MAILTPIFGYAQRSALKYDSLTKMFIKIKDKDTTYFEIPAHTPGNVVLLDRIDPVFRGNKKEFIASNLRYPEEARKKKLEGYVLIDCPLDTNGTPENMMVIYASSPLFEAEALRLAGMMRWQWDEMETFRKLWRERVRIDFKL